MVIFHYYLLGVDTAALSRLYARLCHAFLVLYIICCFFVYCSLIPSLYSSLKSEGHSFVSDELVSSMINTTYIYAPDRRIVSIKVE